MMGIVVTPMSSKNCRYTAKTPKEIDIPTPDTIEIVRRPILVKFRNLLNKSLEYYQFERYIITSI